MRKNTDRKNSEYGQFSRSDRNWSANQLAVFFCNATIGPKGFQCIMIDPQSFRFLSSSSLTISLFDWLIHRSNLMSKGSNLSTVQQQMRSFNSNLKVCLVTTTPYANSCLADNYMFKVNNTNTRIRFEICLEL